MYCKNCGSEVNDNAIICIKCGCSLCENNNDLVLQNPQDKSPKDWITTLLLCIFLGTIGVHRFYVGKIGSGVAQIFTRGGCGIWTFVDLIMILTGSFTDESGKKIISK